MPKPTIREKADAYDGLQRKIDVLEYYLWARESNETPDVVVRYQGHTVKVYGARRAHGGIVVETLPGGVPSVYYFETRQTVVQGMIHGDTLALRIAYERARVEVNRLFQADSATVAAQAQ